MHKGFCLWLGVGGILVAAQGESLGASSNRETTIKTSGPENVQIHLESVEKELHKVRAGVDVRRKEYMKNLGKLSRKLSGETREDMPSAAKSAWEQAVLARTERSAGSTESGLGADASVDDVLSQTADAVDEGNSHRGASVLDPARATTDPKAQRRKGQLRASKFVPLQPGPPSPRKLSKRSKKI